MYLRCLTLQATESEDDDHTILDKAWVFHEIISTDADMQHTKSDLRNEEDPFPKLASLLLAH
jgi:hypothetical protein